jgi:hypothetical protein
MLRVSLGMRKELGRQGWNPMSSIAGVSPVVV